MNDKEVIYDMYIQREQRTIDNYKNRIIEEEERSRRKIQEYKDIIAGCEMNIWNALKDK